MEKELDIAISDARNLEKKARCFSEAHKWITISLSIAVILLGALTALTGSVFAKFLSKEELEVMISIIGALVFVFRSIGHVLDSKNRGDALRKTSVVLHDVVRDLVTADPKANPDETRRRLSESLPKIREADLQLSELPRVELADIPQQIRQPQSLPV